jgi:hypothetical protein
MILCPNCLHKEMVGAIFCSECGAQLVFTAGVPTTEIRASKILSQENGEGRPTTLPKTPEPIPPVSARIALNVISYGEILTLGESGEITLGRVSEGQPIIPDIDLTPYKAYEAGVSRMHASITINEDEVTIADLGTANGTRINGKKITPQSSYPLKHGDIVTLGKFKIQVLLRKK